MNSRDKEARRDQDGARGRARWRPNKPVHELDAGPGYDTTLAAGPRPLSARSNPVRSTVLQGTTT